MTTPAPEGYLFRLDDGSTTNALYDWEDPFQALMICKACGCAVVDASLHTSWHLDWVHRHVT